MKLLSKLFNTYSKGLKYDAMSKSYMDTIIENQELAKTITKERKQFTSVITELENENILLYDTLELTESSSEPLFNLSVTLTNLRKKIGSTPFKYPFKGNGKKYDIRYSLTVKDDRLVLLHSDIAFAKYKPETPIECVEAVIKYFLYDKKPAYVSDSVQFDKRDYWNPADKFLMTFRGDCEDWSIAMHLLMKNLLDRTGNSAHYDRLYLHINENYLEGHANNIWLHEDGFFYTIESSIDMKGTYNKKWLKVPLAYDSFYKKTRGIANLNGSYIGNGEVDSNFRNI